MMSFVDSAMRLGGVVALLIWLPGLVASGASLRPFQLLQPLIIGVGVHLISSMVTSFLTGSISTAVWMLPVVTGALAIAVRVALHRSLRGVAPQPPLSRWPAFAVAVLVLFAAVLRVLHNYHYDDLMHLYYISELERVNQLFPDGFFLEVHHGHVPLLGDGSVLLSRYPFWAVSYAMLSHIGGVMPGDAYLLLGLGVLAIVFAQIASAFSRAWSPAVGCCAVIVIAVASPYLNDSLLNYGGYPFQIGKLFVIMAGAAFICAWRTRRVEDLMPAAIGMFAGPLLHTNNVIGMMTAVCAGLPLLVVPTFRRPAAMAMSAVALLGVLSAGSVMRHGFIRWVPDGTAASASVSPAVVPASPAAAPSSASAPASAGASGPAPSPAPPRSAAVDAVTPPADPPEVRRDRVSRRIGLFLSRGVPLEIVLAAILAFVATGLTRISARADWLWRGAAVVAWVVLAGTVAADAARQVVTSALKPGYWLLRGQLLTLRPTLDPSRPVVTDPITDILLRGAGWRAADQPPMKGNDQRLRILLFHPDVRDNAFREVLGLVGPATIIVNEKVLGTGASTKFVDSALVRPAITLGAEAPRVQTTRASAEALVDSIYGLQFGDVSRNAIEMVRGVAAAMWRRPIRTFTYDGHRSDGQIVLGPLIRGDAPVGKPVIQPFLNSALVTFPGTHQCTESGRLEVRTRASFSSPIMVWRLDRPLFTYTTPTDQASVSPVDPVKRLRLRNRGPQCDVEPMTVIVHSDFWWDTRFDVTSVWWQPSQPQ